MSIEPAIPSAAQPDRQFVRAVAVVLYAGLLTVVAAHFALERAVDRQGRAAQLAMLGTGEAAAAHAVATGLERLATLPEGAARSTAATRLAWDLDQLAAHERQRLAMSYQGTEMRSGVLTAAAAATALARDPNPRPDEAERLGSVFEAQILPQLDRIALRHRTDAKQGFTRSQWTLWGSLALHATVGAALVWCVLRPARRRIRDWVATTLEVDRENRFRLLHDPLTEMPNGTYLHAYLARLSAGAERAGSQTAVLRVDLDRFKMLRETLGERCCDDIIRIAARRIRHVLRGGDFAAYLGQDDFVVVTDDLEGANAAAGIAGRIQAALVKPFSIRGGARRITCSIGVTLLSDDTADPDRILGNARIALGAAQGAGAGHVRYFRESLRQELEQRETLFTELLAGLEQGQLVPYFQPQIADTGAFSGLEALVRWEHPRHGVLAPATFLDFAEQTDLTERIGEVVLTQALTALRDWDAAGLHVPRVGVNFALAQLRDPRLIEKIKWEAERFDVVPGRLAIEVLETVLIKSDTDLVVRNLRGLASAGFPVELDDFGTGHASIANLRRFMVERIKIDQGFVLGIDTSEEQQKLTASMIAMAHALGIATLAEGVETDEDGAMLRALGCDFLQGYAVGAPMSRAETLAWLQALYAPEAAAEPGDHPSRVDPNTP